jgi:hypothetical protein
VVSISVAFNVILTLLCFWLIQSRDGGGCVFSIGEADADALGGTQTPKLPKFARSKSGDVLSFDGICANDWNGKLLMLYRDIDPPKNLKVIGEPTAETGFLNSTDVKRPLSLSHVYELHHHFVGAPWAMGRDVFDALVRFVKPGDRLLDVGCGALRVGHWFIAYLDAHRYYGFDTDAGSIEAAVRYELPLNGLVNKNATVFEGSFPEAFTAIAPGRIDVMLIYKVFMHFHKRYNAEEAAQVITELIARLTPKYVTIRGDVSADSARCRGCWLVDTPPFPFDVMKQRFGLEVVDVVTRESWYRTGWRDGYFRLCRVGEHHSHLSPTDLEDIKKFEDKARTQKGGKTVYFT